MDVQTKHRPPPVSSIHADTVDAPSNQTSKQPRRAASPSTPVAAADARPKQRSPNCARTQAASPAVISSLIDQLSAISLPAHDHFENLMVGYNNGLSASATTSVHSVSRGNSTAGHDGSSVDNSAYNHSLREQNDAFPDDACESPVIRTSKPPSGLSPLTAPKKKDKAHLLSSYIARNSGSSASLHSTHSNHSSTSFGDISIEAGVPKQSSAGSEPSSTESKRSSKGHWGLMYMSSRERLRLKETERKRHTTHSLEDVLSHESPRQVSASLFSYEDTIKEEPTSSDGNEPFQAESSRFAQRYPDRNGGPRRLRMNLVDSTSGESPMKQGIIPERGSSLKHIGSPPRKSRKSRTSGTNRQEPPKPENLVEDTNWMNDKTVMKEKILQELEQEENEVAQRIRELKEQKLQRAKIAEKLPVYVDAWEDPSSVPRVSVVPSPEPSPTSSESSVSDERRVRDCSKAHKVLGITGEAAKEKPTGIETPLRKTEARKIAPKHIVIPKAQTPRHARHRSLTVNDGDDLTPLPIDYTLALQKLEEVSAPTPTTEAPRPISPPPPSISVSSSKESRSSLTFTRRASPSAIGGRSATGRKATVSSLAKGHEHCSSITDVSVSTSLEPPSLRSASADTGMRHHSMIMPLPASNSLLLRRHHTLTKKRWSHSDLPAKAEKKHNDRIERAEAKAAAMGVGAVQRPPRPIMEEWPASMDSIDVKVSEYLDSSRLSQKIRHPQTGRIISFSEVGDPNGFAVFVCMGMGLTRYVMAFYDQLAATLKLRLITPDRPGVGGSQIDPTGTPLSWPDDVLVICQALKITKFSMLAHSAGAVYALATSLRMPQHIRGRVHLLAPWIPPSQMAPIGISQDSPPTQQLPRSQRFLRALPPSLLKVANSTFLSATSAGLQRSGPRNSPKTRRRSMYPQTVSAEAPQPSLKDDHRESMMLMDQVFPNASSLSLASTNQSDPNVEAQQRYREELTIAEREHQRAFDERLTFAIWDRATAHANPATDLIVCLETKQTIGFRYEDINRPVVIHHGSKDSRVPVDNVRWLGKLMRKCEVRILEGESHGLLASAQVMGNVLTEVASEWEDWSAVVQGKGDHRSLPRKRTAERLRSTLSRDDMRTTC